MEVLKKADFFEVLEIFDNEHKPHPNSTNGWARNVLCAANKEFSGEWYKVRLSTQDVLDILLINHLHGGKELIPATGMNVADTAKKFMENKDEYKEKNKECYEEIIKFSQDAFSLIFLSTKPLTHSEKEYISLDYKDNCLVHLDGLHRLVAWQIAGKFDPSVYTQKLEAFIAGHVD